MKKPALIIMAAGMGSRFGGLKQLAPVSPNGELIIDYSIYDSVRAGFGKVVFIIKEETRDDFERILGRRVQRHIPVEYAYQALENLPAGMSVPQGRTKPWGTAHAVLSAKGHIDTPFAVINADDFYGRDAFERIYGFLSRAKDDTKYHYAMAGYKLKNTLTEFGHVARGVCVADPDGKLVSVTERLRIERQGGGIVFIEEGQEPQPLAADTIVSMNMWGFTPSFMAECESRFTAFLARMDDPLKSEYFLPSVVSALINEGKADVSVLLTDESWYGVTYKEDKPFVEKAIAAMIGRGVYSEKLWAL